MFMPPILGTFFAFYWSFSHSLHTACQLGNFECLEVLLEEQPDLSFVNRSGCSPLHVAAQSGNIECVRQILQHKVHVGTQDGRKMTALHHAAAKGHKGCVELLLNNNASLNGKDKDGRTPLLMAIQGAFEDVVKLLLERGAKVNIADNAKKTALMYASLLGLSVTVEMLLKRGANPQLTDSSDHTAEDYARLCHYQDIIDLMRSAPSIATWDAGETSEDTEHDEEESSTRNGEVISQFSSPEESEADTSVSLHPKTVSTMSSNTGVTSSVNGGNLSPQESFSSMASTPLSSPRAANQDLLGDIKELEEENEMLNQELNKLRVQHQKTLDRLRSFEVQQESKAPVVTDCVNRHVEEELLEEKEKRIEELEKEVGLYHQHCRVKGELFDAQCDIPTIPLTVYQQLKESNEDEIFKLTEELEELKITNESLQKSIGKKGSCPQCIQQNSSASPCESATEQHLVAELKQLKYQLEVVESEHRNTINMYRLQLLNACQHEMDPEIQEALQMIIRLRSSEQFC
ncbi:ankycorbin-like [Orbicella faveolata]|uniref:ankycorbin-like n=1 Tax=Orbicella faveolata TaxID=48498 RepID=UPI0009E403C1|nr:ankycorbin-like [Orbicella faveolata]